MCTGTKEGASDADGEISGAVMKLRAHILHIGSVFKLPTRQDGITLVAVDSSLVIVSV